MPSAVLEGMKAAGIEGCHIYHAQDRLVMVIDASDGFSMASAAAINRGNAVVQQWNRRMAALLSGDDRNAPPWNEAHCIFDLERHLRP
ncbi:L-rhamnose mutarotase [Sphingobium algorifonticola]|uniref:L-rhamnose mutarotase n=1 Tax=Sphingobium algorifonticola TaxID=2008318 RepID=UPI003B97035F